MAGVFRREEVEEVEEGSNSANVYNQRVMNNLVEMLYIIMMVRLRTPGGEAGYSCEL